MKIINVGPYPPPVGGVSVYLMRLHKNLLNRKLDSILIDISKTKSQAENILHLNEWRMFFYLLFFQKKSIVHFHVFSLKLSIVYFILSLRHITLLSFHNERFLNLIQSKGKIVFALESYLINKINYIIVFTSKCESLAKKFIKDQKKIYTISNFIKPLDIPEIDHKIILRERQKHKFLISSNAWKIIIDKGKDLYGIDILIEMMNVLIRDYDVVFIFVLPQISNYKYFEKLNKKLEEYKLENNFFFITEALESGSSLWQISDLVIRATNTDITSLTISESLSTGTPVLASDCTLRPKESIIFKTGDVKDLTEKTKKILSRLPYYKSKISNTSIDSGLDSMLNIYNEIPET